MTAAVLTLPRQPRRAPVDVHVLAARTSSEIAMCARLRAASSLLHGTWPPGAQLVEGMELDAYDARAAHLLAWVEHRPVGTARVLFAAPRRLLPVEDLLPLHPHRVPAELSRCVLPEWRGGARGPVLRALVRCAAELAGRRGADDLYLLVDPRMLLDLSAAASGFQPVPHLRSQRGARLVPLVRHLTPMRSTVGARLGAP